MKHDHENFLTGLTFRNLDRDIDMFVEKHGTRESLVIEGIETPVIKGLEQARATVFGAYLAKKAYDAIVHYLLTCWNWDWRAENKFLEQAIDALRRDAELIKLKRLWRGIIAVQRGHFWEMHALRHKLPEPKTSMATVKGAALSSMQRLRTILVEFDDRTEMETPRCGDCALRA